jgi:hypothetical protein
MVSLVALGRRLRGTVPAGSATCSFVSWACSCLATAHSATSAVLTPPPTMISPVSPGRRLRGAVPVGSATCSFVAALGGNRRRYRLCLDPVLDRLRHTVVPVGDGRNPGHSNRPRRRGYGGARWRRLDPGSEGWFPSPPLLKPEREEGLRG